MDDATVPWDSRVPEAHWIAAWRDAAEAYLVLTILTDMGRGPAVLYQEGYTSVDGDGFIFLTAAGRKWAIERTPLPAPKQIIVTEPTALERAAWGLGDTAKRAGEWFRDIFSDLAVAVVAGLVLYLVLRRR